MTENLPYTPDVDPLVYLDVQPIPDPPEVDE